MKNSDFRKQAHDFVDWMADYFESVEKYPVKSQVNPGEIIQKIRNEPPQRGESMENIFNDFKTKILPGITHWQHPNFFAYFPANSSYPSVLAEMLTATLATQCMIWETSPAAAELEEQMMNWLKRMMGIPGEFEGVIQDTASTATLAAIITAREKFSRLSINEKGFTGREKFRVYCSSETHSSVEKAIKIAGLGKTSMVKIPVDDAFRLQPVLLEEAIQNDLREDLKPLCIVATLGTTGTTSIDPLEEIAQISEKYNIWLHVDAALAGTALILPEFRWMIKGIDQADSFVFNPHKWMFTNFDCSVYFVKDAQMLIRTFEILPEYLKTKSRGAVNDYRDWGIPLGRRFRALKLWFVIRSFGVSQLQEKIRNHIRWAADLAQTIEDTEGFERMAPVPLNTVCFRYHPAKTDDENKLDQLNQSLLEKLNKTGKVYFTHTRLNGKFIIRFMIGQTRTTEKHVKNAWDLIVQTAEKSLNI